MASKNNSFYVERTGFSLRLARVARTGNSDVIEEIREGSPETPEDVKTFVQEFSQTKGTAGNLVRACCSIYPSSRLLRSCSLKEGAESGQTKTLEDVVTNQFRVDPAEFALKALYDNDGLEFDPSRQARELFVCGATRRQLKEAQSDLVEAGIYPLRMELGSVATIGLLLAALRAQQIDEPVLVLEIGEETCHVLVLNNNRVESARPLSLGLTTMIAGVRQELGLKDEGAARKLFYSDSFDFREMGPRLIDRLLREVQSMIGYYEVQTGQSITRMLCTLLPVKLSWLTETFAGSLGMSRLQLDLPAFMARSNITFADSSPTHLESHLGLLGLMFQTEAMQ